MGHQLDLRDSPPSMNVFLPPDRGEIAFDPFFSRGRGAPSPFKASSFENCQAIFVGHGHFDHTFDLPQIAKETEVKIFAPGLTGQLLKLRGVPSDRLLVAHNREILLKDLKVRAFHSDHVTFDLPLIASTLKRCSFQDGVHICGLGLAYPKGTVQTYLFEIKGKKVLFASSAGCHEQELKQYRDLEVDYFLAPLQGHSRIQEIAARQTRIINPKVVIPHHHDDFYPPLSQEISVEIFKEQLRQQGFPGQVLEIPLFENAQI